MKYFKYILLPVGGFMVYNILKAGSMANKFVRFNNEEALKLLALQNSMIKAGFKLPQLNFALAQLLFETGRFSKKSTVAKENNNFSGIKYINKPYQKATKGTLSPEGDYYAKFENMEDWAKDFLRIVSLKRTANNIGKPIDATTPEDYVKRLKLNGYFGSSEISYLKGLSFYLKMFNI